MRHVPTLMRRELAAYFLSPMAFLILLAFQLIAWFNFWELLDGLIQSQHKLSNRRDPLNTYISQSIPFWVGLLVAIPALTMRLLAEEKRSGTIETLLTAPVTESEIVVSKWLAGVVMFWVILLPFAVYLPFLYYQAKFYFDPGPLVALGIGLTSLGMMFVSIGLFFSALTRNQIIAAIWTFAILFLVVFLTLLLYFYVGSRRGEWAEGVRYFAVLLQLESFGLGRLDLRYIALHLSVSLFMLYLTVKALQSRRLG